MTMKKIIASFLYEICLIRDELGCCKTLNDSQPLLLSLVNWFAFQVYSPPLVNSVNLQSTNTIAALTLSLGHWGNHLSWTEQQSWLLFMDPQRVVLQTWNPSLSSLCTPKYLADETRSEMKSSLTFIGQCVAHWSMMNCLGTSTHFDIEDLK